jgi:hypothetical protein
MSSLDLHSQCRGCQSRNDEPTEWYWDSAMDSNDFDGADYWFTIRSSRTLSAPRSSHLEYASAPPMSRQLVGSVS